MLRLQEEFNKRENKCTRLRSVVAKLGDTNNSMEVLRSTLCVNTESSGKHGIVCNRCRCSITGCVQETTVAQ